MSQRLLQLVQATGSLASTPSGLSGDKSSGQIINLSTCRYCSRLNPASLSQPNGVIHASSRASLVRSAQRCRLCQLFFRRDRSGRQRLGASADDRKLLVKFEKRDSEDENSEEVGCLRVMYVGADGTAENDDDGLVFWVYTREGV